MLRDLADKSLYSVKMRAAQGGPHEAGGRHISGAERIIPAAEVAAAAGQLVLRAQEHERGKPDFINIKIEALANQNIRELTSLPVYTICAGNCKEGQLLAGKLLEVAGIKPDLARKAINYLLEGPAPGGNNMRGAILLDIHTGCRLEPNACRGLRAAYMDYHPSVLEELTQKLAMYNINHSHTREALCLATKVASVPSIAAELCWSDDPGYVAGYVAAAGLGYMRLEHLKEKGDERGGRVFFFDSHQGQFEETVMRLEREPCLITRIASISGTITFGQFKEIMGIKGA